VANKKANKKAKVAIDQCEDKQTVIDNLDARVADLEVRLHRARQKEDELVMAEEAIATAKKHIESQRTQIAELCAKIKEAGQKTPSTEDKRTNRFLDEFGLHGQHDPIDDDNADEEDQLRVVDSSALAPRAKNLSRGTIGQATYICSQWMPLLWSGPSHIVLYIQQADAAADLSI
jgi:uncharacterized coiled-coil protein SlyX